MDPAAGTVYVANALDGTVSVIDAATSAVTATIPVGAYPLGVAVDPAAGTVYTANEGDGTVSVIDAATRAVTATIPVGSLPRAVAADPATHTAYVANFEADTVSVISRTPVTGPIVSGYHTGTGRCVQPAASPAVNGTPAVLEPCDRSPAQDWTIAPGGTIRSAGGLCLDTYRQQKTSKTPVDLSACDGRPSQQWKPAHGTLVNTASGKCLDDPRFTTPGARLEIYTCHKGANQQWKLPA